MKIVEINMTLDGSTGKIMLQIAKQAREEGIDVRTYSTHPASKRYNRLPAPPMGHKYYGNFVGNDLHMILGTVSGYHGCFSRFSTMRLLSQIRQFAPDIVHLHNLHASYINLPMLFSYLKENKVKTVWTLHDCWAFTGQCPHFTMVKCERWKTGCHDCPQIHNYPATYRDVTPIMWEKKKEWVTSVSQIYFVTPSQWLAELVQSSYLKGYPVTVINNGIDLGIFKPTSSDFKTRYKCEGKHILLGISFSWGKRKGLDVLIELSKRLGSDYQIVLVGTNDKIDSLLPGNIISIHSTQNQGELAEIYSAADIFLNPTREENYPTVNMEAIACGTPVITFNTGGSSEILDENCGAVVPCDDIDSMEREIYRMIQQPYETDKLLKKAKEFDAKDRYNEYVRLYRKIAGGVILLYKNCGKIQIALLVDIWNDGNFESRPSYRLSGRLVA